MIFQKKNELQFFLVALEGKLGTLKDLLAPALPSSNSFKDLKDALKSHFIPKAPVFTQRFKFHCRMQLPSNYADSLRSVMYSLHSQAMHKKRILMEDNLTLNRVVEIAIRMETAQKHTRIFSIAARKSSGQAASAM